MTWLSDPTLEHLRQVADFPDLSQTRYRDPRPLARGGMASVFVAVDTDLDRPVALKVLAGSERDPVAAERMIKEARIVARLEHPGIVPVHDIGTLPDGRIFYTMKLVRGRRLDEVAAESAPITELLRLFERICEPVAFAHDRGVIHRDLKPQNIMVGAFGEVLVMDWGLAKIIDRQAAGDDQGPEAPSARASVPFAAGDDEAPTLATAHGTIMGTPGFMAPEQAEGRVELLDERTDVFALGAIIHFLLVGEPPPAVTSSGNGTSGAAGTGVNAASADGSRVAVDLIRSKRPSVPRALEAICRKALAPDPQNRYQRVSDLAADVRRFLDASRVRAHSEGPLGTAVRLASKYRAPLLLILAYLTMRVLLILFTG